MKSKERIKIGGHQPRLLGGLHWGRWGAAPGGGSSVMGLGGPCCTEGRHCWLPFPGCGCWLNWGCCGCQPALGSAKKKSTSGGCKRQTVKRSSHISMERGLVTMRRAPCCWRTHFYPGRFSFSRPSIRGRETFTRKAPACSISSLNVAQSACAASRNAKNLPLIGPPA
jgi:hypothetical protein